VCVCERQVTEEQANNNGLEGLIGI
jgi:hypothetical protein